MRGREGMARNPLSEGGMVSQVLYWFKKINTEIERSRNVLGTCIELCC